MTLLPLTLAALAGSTDLNGDGTPDAVVAEGEAVWIGNATVSCGGDSFPCETSILDCNSSDNKKEVSICEIGARDDRSCRLYAYDGSAAHEISLQNGNSSFYVSEFICHGNGIILADQLFRLYTRRDKFVLSEGRDEATHYAQPFYVVDFDLTVNRTFPIKTLIQGGKTVANVRPDSQITILLESAEATNWYLIRISSGLTGWVDEQTLTAASNQLMAIMGAG